jgi:hypothetical protein
LAITRRVRTSLPTTFILCVLCVLLRQFSARGRKVFFRAVERAMRDHLVSVVFPELRERVEQLGLEFFDVDPVERMKAEG